MNFDLQGRPDHNGGYSAPDGSHVEHPQASVLSAERGLSELRINTGALGNSGISQSNNAVFDALEIYGIMENDAAGANHALHNRSQANNIQYNEAQANNVQVRNMNVNISWANDPQANTTKANAVQATILQPDCTQSNNILVEHVKAKNGPSEIKIYGEKWTSVMFVRKYIKQARRISWLEQLPAEILREILSYLLINPLLGDIEVIISGKPCRLDLHPAVLITCKMLNKEALAVLYGANRFAISCLPSSIGEIQLFASPLTRYNNIQRDFEDRSKDRATHLPYGAEHTLVKQIPGFSQVRNWNIIATPCYDLDDGDDHELLDGSRNLELLLFCRAACLELLKSISIHPICRHPKCVPDKRAPRGHRTMSFEEFFKPLLLFRGLKLLKLETSHEHCRVPLGQEILGVIQSTVQGYSPVDRLFLTYHLLLTYAQSFEQCVKFKADMGRARASNCKKMRNPFLSTPRHPMEDALNKAKRAANDGRGDLFIAQLPTILVYMDTQYKAIESARQVIAQDIIGSNPIFDATPQFTYVKPQGMDWPVIRQKVPFNSRPQQLVHLEQYNLSFVRRPTESVAQAAGSMARFYQIYTMTDESMVITQLRWALQHDDFEQAEKYYKRALTHLDARFSAIKHARTEFLSHDRKGNPPPPPVIIL